MNIEVRRIMLEILGIEKYIEVGNFEQLDQDKDQFGRERILIRKKFTGDEDLVRVKVINSSPELDKSFKTYFLPVEPNLRPLLKDPDEQSSNMDHAELIANGYLGKPQEMNCRNAVASTFGKYGNEYGVPGQTRQGDVFIEFKDGSNHKPFRES